ncbi:MAG: hypothetical protein A2W97_11885 [Bacteroidetes bacterium GWE2_40_63]|jgi:hypothetical protein|nr:MAG: hypothetical protein A2W95_07985 [Bacteroidetes bacterium GWA2_40_14]OFX60408.1 MAG: hypothetical protein A2W84_04780 [Bacteroidetes bacterium GWC2_40_13]OFX72977.1 MAG: hypothetical protein A2W96_18865 [Bacteroidetes bacterium GWD2_40_43]OFX91870.1 MAG: hypothetical protein A2W97_11885 [Bacteroidetes bacterium GWE2_40_63]OFY19832.1 MAG: hypothetical protein A2W88_03550 [Bacteroidetes bacterium GWF2_40_13]OFZ28242.1 MAG: hypothetical protein A2437_05055 [Bacteroidetes bacterium RIFOXYC
MKHRVFYGSMLLILLMLGSCRKSNFELPDGSEVITDKGEGTGTVTWTKEMNLVLEGFVFVNDGQVLTIEPGTVIRFKSGQGATASALIVARGGKIIANGTKDAPIVFTAEADDLNGSVAKDATGLWGGILILGRAPLNTDTGRDFIEGIPASEPRGEYGGSQVDDNSGELSFASIRYAGSTLYHDNEINGLTLGGVGSSTKIENIEIINSADDGIEIFGGTVNLKNIISFHSDDDAIDYDLGYQGQMQFVFAVQAAGSTGNLVEGSGASDPVYQKPYSVPYLSNLTMIGNPDTTAGKVISLNRFAGGIIVNSIFVEQQIGATIEYSNASTDCYAQWLTGKLKIENNLFYQVGFNEADSIFKLNGLGMSGETTQNWAAYFELGNNQLKDVGITAQEGFNYLPTESTGADLFTHSNDWFEVTNYKGAFGTYNWTEGWSSFKEHL